MRLKGICLSFKVGILEFTSSLHIFIYYTYKHVSIHSIESIIGTEKKKNSSIPQEDYSPLLKFVFSFASLLLLALFSFESIFHIFLRFSPWIKDFSIFKHSTSIHVHTWKCLQLKLQKATFLLYPFSYLASKTYFFHPFCMGHTFHGEKIGMVWIGMFMRSNFYPPNLRLKQIGMQML